jgi:transposase InsO family protein
VGYYAGLQGPARHGRAALDMAVNRQLPHGARDQGLCLMSDHGGQPTSTACISACSRLGIQHAFTSDGNPKGHADTARLIRTRNEACCWLPEWTGPLQLMGAFTDGSAHDNEHYSHAALGYKSPRRCAQDDRNRHGPPFAAA